jgi:protein-S-isoprenylcysteine O-methyltransferase Ste14
MAMDAIRFGWSSAPEWLQAAEAFYILLGAWVSCRTMRQNSFAAPVVKIQRNRGQAVVTTGPYGFVRHPIYLGRLLLFFGAPLLLGSLWGLQFR